MADSYSFGAWVRRRRRALDLTQDALALRVGCAVSMVRKIELDERRPSKQLAALLATGLELPEDERTPFLKAARAELASDQLTALEVASASSASPATRPHNNLPAPISSFLGREPELADLRAFLLRADVRLVTLTGPGGTGKTRLALQSAADLLGSFPDGVCFVDLAPIGDPALVATTIAQALGVTTSERTANQLKAALRHMRLLLVLDNYEHLLTAAPLVAELLAAAPHLKVLVTSRAGLHLTGEHEYAVPPLAIPPTTDDRRLAPDDPHMPGQATLIGQYAAVQLFIVRTRAAKADFALTDANALAVAAICRRLDGLPLAIELAAARVKLFPPKALLERLGDRLGLLTGGARDLPARQQTIRDTIDWSYNLLSAGEQRLFRHLGVFVGGWTLEAAEAVAAELRVENAELRKAPYENTFLNSQFSILNSHQALVDHSLVRQAEEPDGAPRFTMLETVREYALERLHAAGEEMDVRRRHAAFFTTWAEESRSSLRGDAMITSAQLRCELGNFRAALDWSFARVEEDSRYGLRLFGNIWEFWFQTYPTEGGAIAKRALACALGLPQDLASARIYNAAARLQKYPWRSKEAKALLERSLALARQYADRPLQAEVLRHLGEAAHYYNLQAAELFFEESLQISRELNDAEQEAWTTANLAGVAARSGDLAGAERCCQHSLAIFARLNYTFGQALMLYYLAFHAEQRGDHAEADGYLARAIVLMEHFGPSVGFSPLIVRGQLACQRGDYQHALDLLRQGYDQVAQVDASHLETAALMWQAVCYLELGDLAAATARCRHALEIALEFADNVGVSRIAMIVANIAVAHGMHIAATGLLGCADVYLASTSYTFAYDHETEWKRLHGRALGTCQTTLGADAFDAAWAAGQALTLDQAVAEALALAEPLAG